MLKVFEPEWLLCVEMEETRECSMVVAAGLEGLVRMKQTDGETFHSLVKHQFGQLLSLSPQEIKEVWEGRKRYRLPGRRSEVGLTRGGVQRARGSLRVEGPAGWAGGALAYRPLLPSSHLPWKERQELLAARLEAALAA